MFDEPVADRAAAAVHDVQHAGRKPGFREQLDEALAERGRVGRWLEDDRVAAHERGRDLPRRDRDREVPRRDRADDADRLPHAHVELVAQLRRRRLSEQATSLAGHVEAHVDRLLHVAAGLRLHLPHLVRHQVGEVVLLLGQEIREAVEDLAALRRRHEPPLLERGLRRLDRAVDVLGVRAREDHRSHRRSPGSCSRTSRRTPSRPTRRRCSSGRSSCPSAPRGESSQPARPSRGRCRAPAIAAGRGSCAAPGPRRRLPPLRFRRSGPLRRSMITVTFGLSL